MLFTAGTRRHTLVWLQLEPKRSSQHVGALIAKLERSKVGAKGQLFISLKQKSLFFAPMRQTRVVMDFQMFLTLHSPCGSNAEVIGSDSLGATVTGDPAQLEGRTVDELIDETSVLSLNSSLGCTLNTIWPNCWHCVALLITADVALIWI